MDSFAKQQKPQKEVPSSFIYEIMDGKPIYYKGYRKALEDEQDAEPIRGIRILPAVIISHLLSMLFKIVNRDEYRVFGGNPGIQLDENNHLVARIMVIDKQIFPSSKISTNYIDVPALVQIEMDVQAELEDITETGYIKTKTQKLLDFGTGKVIWIFTEARQVLIVTPGEDWKWVDWNKPVELWQGTSFCINDYLKAQEIILE